MKTQKGIALITVMLLIMLMFTFSVCICTIIEKNLNFFTFYANKETTRSLAAAAINYLTAKGAASSLTWYKITNELFATADIKLDPKEPYYFKIQDTNYPDANLGEYQFIGIIKNISGEREISRTVLRAQKPLADIKKLKQSWTR